MTSAHDSNDVRILKKQCVSLAKNSENEVYLVAKGEDFEYKNVQVKGVGSFTGGRIARVLNVSRAVYEKAIEIDADIYQFHDPELLLYAKKLKKHGKIVIFDSHENYQEQIMEKGYIPKIVRGAVRLIYAVIENFACKSIDAALYPGEDNPYIGKVKECVPIYNTPMLDELTPTIPFAEKKSAVCCVGTLSETRGIKVLAEACYKAGITLVLAGNFSSKEFEEKLRLSNAFSIVDYRGICDRKQVNEIYDECLIGADTILNVGQYPLTNCLSTKVYEYMIMGMPYITSDFEYNKSIIEQYQCGIYVNPADSEKIAQSILYLVNNRDLAEKMGINGRKIVEEQFSWNQDEERLIKLYERLYDQR